MFLAFFAFNEINNLRVFNVAFSSIRTAPASNLIGPVDHTQGAETILISYFFWVARPFGFASRKRECLSRTAYGFASLRILVSLNFDGSNKAGSSLALAFMSK
jgi:hypothetical protein